MRQLYICSHPFSNDFDNTLRPRLIGILRELKPGTGPAENGEYEFEYAIGNNPDFPEKCIRLYKLSDSKKVYNNDEIRHLLNEWLPMPYSIWFDNCLKAAGLPEYDEWKWIIHFGRQTPQRYAFVYENLPDEVIRYDN